ncbi:hypothetical protein [uncultured Chryseobacterium sp.]|uniref:hypothetical protein n=1 Tax=uncultured Chryseobacterium sp. TaxID=259322 RepID=UPI0025F40AE7|nr:hypothetical protein [uncultured Chryseobacterium sp.]
MKNARLINRTEMKSIIGGSICTSGNSNYEICYNCSIAYGTAPEVADRLCSVTSGQQTT